MSPSAKRWTAAVERLFRISGARTAPEVLLYGVALRSFPLLHQITDAGARRGNLDATAVGLLQAR